MQLEHSVEVTVKEGDSSKARGDLLEKLAKRLLIAMQYEHVRTDVRVTGCELDVTAQHRQTGARVLVECKAYRDRQIAAEVLAKLMGNVHSGLPGCGGCGTTWNTSPKPSPISGNTPPGWTTAAYFADKKTQDAVDTPSHATCWCD